MNVLWTVLGLWACWLGEFGWWGCLRWDGCIHMLWWVGRLGSLSIGGTMPPIPWVMSSPQAHNHMHILSMKPPSPPHTHTYLHTNPKEENENSLVLTITTTKHIWKNVGSCQDVFKNTIFQVSCVNILSENVGALFLYFTNNWQV